MGKETGFLQRLNAALMPDYPRAAAVYWWGLLLVGASVLALAATGAATRPLPSLVEIVAVCLASMLAGSFPVPLPGTKSSFSAAEIFVFLGLLYVGLDAACLAAAAEAFVASARTSKRWTSRLVSPAVAAVSIGITGAVFLQLVDALERQHLYGEGTVLALLPAMATLHFLLTGWLVRMVLHLKADKPLRMRVLLGSFGWIGSTYAANAFIAALLYVSARHAGPIVLLAAGPMIALLLTTLHFHFRQREAEAAEARARIEAAEAVAAQTARHNAELRRLAGNAGMTPLADREGFLARLAEAFQPQACIHRSFAVMYLEMDGFERIRQTLGQAAGDEILMHVANRIQRRVRRCDLVGRLGAEKFAVLVKELESERVLAVAERLLEAVSTPYAVSGVTAQSSASMGITLSDYGYQAPEDMLRDAQAAMSTAKSLGGGHYALHHPDVLQRTAVPERNALVDA